jgi:formamidopyrimidine-DNA glycosylase
MSGSMRLLDQPPVGETHVHAWWRLEPANGSMFWMRHRDPRRFGWLESHASLASVRERRWSLLGPDALGVTVDALNACLAGTRRPLKSALLDQTCVAGLGNIYVDEALFRAGLHPCTRTHRLQERHVRDLAHAITSILRKAVERGGSTIQDHRGADGTWGSFQKLHRVYGRAGLPCVRCGTSLRRRLVSQRTTVFCPDCQPMRPR